MTHQERLMLLTLKAEIDGRVSLAKAYVRAAFDRLPSEEYPYGAGYRDSNRRKTVQHLRDLRDIQRHVHEYCKGVGYYV